MVNIILALKKELKTKEILFGSKVTVKFLKDKDKSKVIEKIYFANDCPQDIKEEIKRLAERLNIEIIFLEIPREELRDLCKKPFNISVLDVLTEKKFRKEQKQEKTEQVKKEKPKKKKETKPEKEKKKAIKKETKKKTKKSKKKKEK